MKISANAENIDKLTRQLANHQAEAHYAYKSKSNDKETYKNDAFTKVYTFDMQQCLPTPDLFTSVAFYKRQLWTFNLTVHDCITKQSFNYMWHEAVGGRGANQVASCLYKHLFDLPMDVIHVILYSDTCGGQDKNTHVVAMLFTLLQNNQHLETIDHKFLVAGHTHMECDTDHSLIERTRKKYGSPINHPHDWMQLVRQTGKGKPFIVKEMKREDFYDYASLFKNSLQQKKVSEEGEKFVWKAMKWLRYDRQQCGILYYKTSVDPLEPFKTISFKRRSRSNVPLNPKLCYEGPIDPLTMTPENKYGCSSVLNNLLGNGCNGPFSIKKYLNLFS